MRNALQILQEINFIIFKSEPKKEDIIADILLMRAYIQSLGSDFQKKGGASIPLAAAIGRASPLQGECLRMPILQ